jgi:hypothetical protein
MPPVPVTFFDSQPQPTSRASRPVQAADSEAARSDHSAAYHLFLLKHVRVVLTCQPVFYLRLRPRAAFAYGFLWSSEVA